MASKVVSRMIRLIAGPVESIAEFAIAQKIKLLREACLRAETEQVSRHALCPRCRRRLEMRCCDNTLALR